MLNYNKNLIVMICQLFVLKIHKSINLEYLLHSKLNKIKDD